MIKTINQINKEFNEIATQHRQIHGYYFGQFWEAYESDRIKHSFLIIDILNSSFGKAPNAFTQVQIQITVADRVLVDQFNFRDVKNDTLLIMNDIWNTLNSHRWHSWAKVVGNTQAQYFRQKGGDVVDGWVMTVTLQVHSHRELCAIPFIDYDFNENLAPACAPATVLLNGDPYSTVDSGGIIDVIVEVTPIPELTATQLNDVDTGLTISQRQEIQMIWPIKSGQTTSYVANDDGAQQKGRLVDFFTLSSANPFGNTNRFTAIDGTQNVIGNGNIMVDWATNKMWVRATQPNQTWANAVSTAESTVYGGYSDWRLPNIVEYNTLSNFEYSSAMNWLPLSVANSLWSSTTFKGDTTTAWFYGSGGQGGTASKAASVEYLIVRDFIYSDLGF